MERNEWAWSYTTRSFTRRKNKDCKAMEKIFCGQETAWAWVHSVVGAMEKRKCSTMWPIVDSELSVMALYARLLR